LALFIEGMRTTNMVFVNAKAEDVRDSILTEVQLEKHDNIEVDFDSQAWVICFPKDSPVVHVKMRRVDQEEICVDFCRVGSDYTYFEKWQEILIQVIENLS
jgi:hypothetical protein